MHRRFAIGIWFALGGAASGACSTTALDGETEAGADAGADVTDAAGLDATSDTTVTDALLDAPLDALVDAPADSSADAGDGAISPPRCDATISLVALPPLSTAKAYTRRPAVADVNGDGVLDVAVTSHERGVDVFRSVGSLLFDRTTLSAGSDASEALFGDVTGDHVVDLVVTNYGGYPGTGDGLIVLPGVGDGTFGAAIDTDTGDANPVAGALADFDGDGKLDVAVNHNNGGWTTTVLINQGDGRFVAKWSRELGANPHFVQAADFNGDGKPDLAVSTYFDGLKVALNAGDGTFGSTISLATAAGYPGDLIAADLNHDRKIDLAIVTLDGGKISVLLNDGTPFSTHAEYAITSPSDGMTVADLDGKNGPDLITGSHPSSIAVLLNEGDGTFEDEKLLASPPLGDYFAPGDFNLDGRPDVVGTFDSNHTTDGPALVVLLGACL